MFRAGHRVRSKISPAWNRFRAELQKWLTVWAHSAINERSNSLGLTTLATRRLRGDLTKTYKILTHKEIIDPNQFFLFNDTRCSVWSQLEILQANCQTQRSKAILQLSCNRLVESIASACGRRSNCEYLQERTR